MNSAQTVSPPRSSQPSSSFQPNAGENHCAVLPSAPVRTGAKSWTCPVRGGLFRPDGRSSSRQIRVLKADVHLADVVQSHQDAKPCGSCLVQVVPAARAGQPFTECRLFQQGPRSRLLHRQGGALEGVCAEDCACLLSPNDIGCRQAGVYLPSYIHPFSTSCGVFSRRPRHDWAWLILMWNCAITWALTFQ